MMMGYDVCCHATGVALHATRRAPTAGMWREGAAMLADPASGLLYMLGGVFALTDGFASGSTNRVPELWRLADRKSVV